MKMKFRCGLLAILLLGSSVSAKAGNGLKRNSWDCGPEITVSNLVYGEIGAFGLEFLRQGMFGDDDRPWWFPTMGMKCVTTTKVDYSKGYYNNSATRGYYIDNKKNWVNARYSTKIRDGFLNFTEIPSYSFGYRVSYMSKELPIGFSAKVAYEQQGFDAKMEGDEEYTKFRKKMIVPELLAKIRIGKYMKDDFLFVANVGACYDYTLEAQGFHEGKDAVNDGVTGIIGISAGYPAWHLQIGMNYYHPFYDYFNKDYSSDGTYPQADASATVWGFNFYVTLGF